MNRFKQLNIFHISDLHIRSKRDDKWSQHDDILFAADQMITKCRPITKTKQCVLIIAGDIFDRINGMLPSNIQCFKKLLTRFLKELPNLKIIIVPGNHDRYKDSSLNEDWIGAILEENGYGGNVFYVSKTEVLHLLDCEFHVFQFSEKEKKIPKLEKTDIIRVAIIHEMVKENHWESYKYSVDDFKDFDAVVAGDVHQHWIRGNFAYSGSFIQKDMSESLDHGFIHWEINKGHGTSINFHPLVLNSAFIKLNMENSVVNWNGFDRKKFNNIRSLRIDYKKCDMSSLAQKIEEIERECNTKATVVSMDKISFSAKDKNIAPMDQLRSVLFNDSPVENSYDEEFFKKHPYHKERVLEMKKKYITSVKKSRKKWDLNYLEWSNLFVYGEDNYINFDDLSGINNVTARNTSGKSKVIDILLFALCDHFCKGYSDGIMKHESDNYKLRLLFTEITDDGTQIPHIITIKKKKNGRKEMRLKYGNGKNDEISDVNNFKEYMCKFCTYQNLIRTNFLLDKNTSILQVQYNSKEEGIVEGLENFFELDVFSDTAKKVTLDRDELERSVQCKKYELIDSGLEELVPGSDRRDKCKPKNQINHKVVTEKLIELKKKNDLVAETFPAQQKEYDMLSRQIEELEKENDDLTKTIISLQKDIENYSKEALYKVSDSTANNDGKEYDIQQIKSMINAKTRREENYLNNQKEQTIKSSSFGKWIAKQHGSLTSYYQSTNIVQEDIKIGDIDSLISSVEQAIIEEDRKRNLVKHQVKLEEFMKQNNLSDCIGDDYIAKRSNDLSRLEEVNNKQLKKYMYPDRFPELSDTGEDMIQKLSDISSKYGDQHKKFPSIITSFIKKMAFSEINDLQNTLTIKSTSIEKLKAEISACYDDINQDIQLIVPNADEIDIQQKISLLKEEKNAITTQAANWETKQKNTMEKKRAELNESLCNELVRLTKKTDDIKKQYANSLYDEREKLKELLNKEKYELKHEISVKNSEYSQMKSKLAAAEGMIRKYQEQLSEIEEKIKITKIGTLNNVWKPYIKKINKIDDLDSIDITEYIPDKSALFGITDMKDFVKSIAHRFKNLDKKKAKDKCLEIKKKLETSLAEEKNNLSIMGEQLINLEQHLSSLKEEHKKLTNQKEQCEKKIEQLEKETEQEFKTMEKRMERETADAKEKNAKELSAIIASKASEYNEGFGQKFLVIEEQIKNKEQELDTVKNDNIKKASAKREKLADQIKNKRQELDKIENNIIRLTEELKTRKQQVIDGCFVLKDKLASYQEKQFQKINAKLESIKQEREMWSEYRSIIENTNIEKNIQHLRDKKQFYTSLLSEINKFNGTKMKAIHQELTTLRQIFNLVVSSSISRCNDQLLAAEQKLEANKEVLRGIKLPEIAQIKLSNEKIKNQITKLEAYLPLIIDYEAINTFLEYIDKRKGLPFTLLLHYVKIVGEEMNDILKELKAGFTVSFGKNGEKISNSSEHSVDDKLILYVTPDGKTILETGVHASGYQRAVVDLVFRLVLCRNHPFLPRFLIMDECFGAYDHEHKEHMKDFLIKIGNNKMLNWIMNITHIQDFDEVTDQKINIEKNSTHSVLKYGKKLDLDNIKLADTPKLQKEEAKTASKETTPTKENKKEDNTVKNSDQSEKIRRLKDSIDLESEFIKYDAEKKVYTCVPCNPIDAEKSKTFTDLERHVNGNNHKKSLERHMKRKIKLELKAKK